MADVTDEVQRVPSPVPDDITGFISDLRLKSPAPSTRHSPYIGGASPLPSPFIPSLTPNSCSPLFGGAMPRDVDLCDGVEHSPSAREALARQAAAAALRHRLSSSSRNPPRPGRLNSGDLATEVYMSAFTTTPMGRITAMSTPMSRDKDLLGGESRSMLGRVSGTCTPLITPMSARRRAASDLSWMEDGVQDRSKRHWGEASASSLGDGDGDSSGGPHRPQISLSAPGWDARLCCAVPGVLLFGMIAMQLVIAGYSAEMFLASTGIITAYVFLWTTNMSLFSAVGAWRMRRDSSKNWYAMSQEAKAAAKAKGATEEIMHIVIIPNYKEDEDMLLETLTNIALSPCAKESIRVVLGMEEREGPEGALKADRLIESTSHLFADIFAAYHPPGRAGEMAGKSSNSQWAYRAALGRYADVLSRRDPSRVFISVGDADTLWNPQYFDALTYEGYTKTAEELSWTIWQPPMLLFRNLFAVPAVTRLSGFGTLLFEVSGLANQAFCTHFCFSSYSLTLALANHRKVRGWDTDVVAEDHHMFIKCFFAPLWEQVEAQCEDKSGKAKPLGEPAAGRVRLQPVYLPAEGYLVESSGGYWASVWARFQQARRHSQGVSELGYAVLQYWRILKYKRGRSSLSWATHREVLSIMLKMCNVHIINSVQAISILIALIMALVGISSKFLSDGMGACIASLMTEGIAGVGATGFTSYELAKWGLFLTFGPAPPIGFISAAAIYIVVRDVVEGRYTKLPTDGSSDALKRSDSGSEDASPQPPSVREPKNLSTWQAIKMAVSMQLDMLLFAEPTILLYGLVPVVMASWSLLWRGTEFEYIVAAKPGDNK